jgi:hypothetical protein
VAAALRFGLFDKQIRRAPSLTQVKTDNNSATLRFSNVMIKSPWTAPDQRASFCALVRND